MKKLTLMLAIIIVASCANRPAKFASGDIVCVRHIDKCGVVTTESEKIYDVSFVDGKYAFPEKRLEQPKQKSFVGYFYSK